jgi:hypothetical protein
MIDDAIQIIQAHALDCSYGDGQVKLAPAYPTESAAALPMSIAHLGNGQAIAMNSTTTQFMPVVFVDFHFARVNLTNAYRQIDSVIRDFCRRLGGDPNLSGVVDTIIFPVTWSEPTAVQYNTIETLMVRFSVPLKTLETPIT